MLDEYLDSLTIKRNRTSLMMNSFMHNVVDIENSIETSKLFLKWYLFLHLYYSKWMILYIDELILEFKMDLIKKIRNYTINERHCLGEGSFGKVYEGISD